MLLKKIADRESISAVNRKSLVKINCEIRESKIIKFHKPEIEMKIEVEHIALNLGHG